MGIYYDTTVYQASGHKCAACFTCYVVLNNLRTLFHVSLPTTLRSGHIIVPIF